MVSIWLTNRLTEDRAGDRTRRIENGVARAASAWERFSGRAWLRGAHKKRRSPKRRPSALPMATQDQGAAGQIGGAWGLRPTLINADRRAWFRRPCEYFRNATARSTRRSVSDARDDATGIALLLPVLLDSRGAQPGETVTVDRILPGEELLDRERVAAAGLLQRQKASAHSRNNLGLASDHPAFGPWGRQVRNRERATVWPDDIFDPRAMGFGHGYSHALD